MKFKFTKLAALVVIAAVALSIAPIANAQSGYVKTFDLPKTPTTDGAYKGVDPSGTTIVWWHNHSQDRETALKAIIDKFNKGNPWKITVNELYKGQYPDIYQAMLAGLQTKDLPGLTVAYQNEAGTYQTANGLVDLNDFVNDKVYGFGDEGLADFFQGFLASDINSQFNNQRLGFALYRSMEVLFYNVDALKALGHDAPPKTWDEFQKWSCDFTKANPGKIGYEVRTDASFIAAAAFAQGGDIFDYKANKFTYNSPAVQVAPQVIQDMLNNKCASLIANPQGRSDQNDFATGKSLFYIASSSGITFVAGAIKSAPQHFTFNTAPIPYKDQPVQNVYGASVSIPKTNPKTQLAAWLFIRWFSEPEQQAAWAQASQYFPVRQSTATGLADFFSKNPAYKTAFDLLKNTKAEPPFAGYNPIRTEADKAFNDVLDGQNVAERFGALNNTANDLLTKYKPNLTPATPKPATKAATAAATMSATAAATMAATAAK